MIGEVLSSYVIERKLGEGGMGEVYVAAHRRIARRVAIKLLLPELSRDQAVVDRFFTEARATSVIDHPNIVQVVDCDIHPSGRAYIIMEYLRGESLAKVLRRVGDMRNDLRAFLGIGAQIADALGAAHAKGIIHRDLKPDNIFLTRATALGRVPVAKVLDFGIAKLAAGSGIQGSKTRTGSLLGTPLYMSPEQCRGIAGIDLRSDIYSLGCVFLEMLTGRPPFDFEGFGELIVAHVSQVAERPSERGVTVPAEIETLLFKMLAKAPADRPASMSDVAAVLRAVETALGPGPVKLAIEEAPEDAVGPTGAESPKITPQLGGTSILHASPPAAAAAPAPTGGAAAAAVTGGTRILPTGQTTLSRGAGEVTMPPGSRDAPRSRWPIAAGGAVTALAVAVAVWALVLRPAPERPVAPAPPRTEAVPAPTTPPTPPPTPPVLPTTVVIDVRNAPPGLTTTVDGEPRSLPVRIARDGRAHAFLFRADGYKDDTRTIEATGDQVLSLDLAKERPAAAAGGRPPHHTGRHDTKPTADAKPTPTPTPKSDPAPTPTNTPPKKPSAITDI